MRRAETLWSQGKALDARMLAYTVGDDPVWDARLLRWDILGSLGHAEGLRRSRIISEAEHTRMRRALRAALRAAAAGKLRIEAQHEDVHSAVELWLPRHLGAGGERRPPGRSRNDQVAVDLRLYLKDRVLSLHAEALGLAGALAAFAAKHRRVLWPGYTHQRRGMPSSAGLWAAAYAEGVLDTAESLAGIWPSIDRSPLGSAAGYGAPLPLRREAAARALGFAGLDRNVATVQNGRGKLEAAVLFWCTQLGHELGRFATDVIHFSAEEYGYLVLPADLATGSSIMPQKRNPDLFELTRARTAVQHGELAQVLARGITIREQGKSELAQVLALSAKLGGGYHRDFQLLKGPLMRGTDATGEMLAMMAAAVPRLGVDAERGLAALAGPTLATDEVMRRVRGGHRGAPEHRWHRQSRERPAR